MSENDEVAQDASVSRNARGTTMIGTAFGHFFDLASPAIDDISLMEIAKALSNQCRYNGNIMRFYSVAEHSLLISEFLEGEGRPIDVVFGGLMHDAAEAYTGDITYPMQQVLFAVSPWAREAYKQTQRKLDALISERCGIDVIHLHCDAVRDADLRILLDEKAALTVDAGDSQWDVERMGLKPLGVQIQGLPPAEVEKLFVVRLRELLVRVNERTLRGSSGELRLLAHFAGAEALNEAPRSLTFIEPPRDALRGSCDDVATFMEIAGQTPVALPSGDDDPVLLTAARMCESYADILKGLKVSDTRHLRARLMLEELGETLEALAKGDEVGVADGLVDLLYVTVGAGVAFGLPLPAVWDAVQTANLAKFPNGVVLRDENGKVVKPAGWKPPDVKQAMKNAGYVLREEAP